MNIGTVFCLALCCIFAGLAAVFAVCKGKAAMLVSGFNTLPKEERDKYDAAAISAGQRNALLAWAGVMGAGALLSALVSAYLAVAAALVWLVLLMRDVHTDTEKAFAKYKKE